MKTLDLTQFSLSRPEKVKWVFPYQGGDVLDYVKSKGLRKFLRSYSEVLVGNNIRFTYKQLSRSDYLNWLPIYEENARSKNFDIFATPEWYDLKMSENKEVWGFFFYQNDALIASSIITKFEKLKAISSFKVSKKIQIAKEHNSSVGSLVDYTFLKTMVSESFEEIKAGMSRNAFGVINSLGYLDYKLRFGYKPEADPNSKLLNSVPLNEDGIVLSFCCNKHNDLGLYALVPQGVEMKFEQERFATNDMLFKYIQY